MKKVEIKNILLFSILSILVILNNFIFKIIPVNNIYCALLFLIVFGLSIWVNGNKKDNKYNTYDVVQVFLIYTLSFLVLFYLGGLIVGFNRNIFSLKILSILKNTIPVILLIYLQEKTRYLVVSESKDKYSIALVTLFLIIFNISINVGIYNFNNGIEIFEFIGKIILPTILSNILLTFSCYRVGNKANYIYRYVTEMYIYLIPIIPNYGPYLESIFMITLPVLIFLKLNSMFSKNKIREEKSQKIIRYCITSFLVIIIGVIACLISGIFRYQIIAIGSNSMRNSFSRGDTVIINKIRKEKEINDLKIGDVIAYKHNNKLIVHRIVKIEKINDNIFYTTKGDNNQNNDDVEVDEDMIVGKVELIIKYIGYPSVYLSERF